MTANGLRFHHLGHASWLVEASGLRIVMDPLLFERHAGGVFEVTPRRRIEARALAADFVLVSHAHFDHFDLDSLAALAAADPETVFVTSDALVADAATLLGFRTVRQIPPGTRVELANGLAIATTPSCAPDVEWGVVVMDESGVVWNMIDTVFPGVADVRRTWRGATGGRRIDLTLAPIQSLREIALATAGDVGFQVPDHRHLLACAAATDAAVLSPSACGEAFAAPYQAMNAWVYPVSRWRAGRDLERFAPGVRALIPALGEALVVAGGEVTIERGNVPIERLGDGSDPRFFCPLEPAPMVDPNLDGRGTAAMREQIVQWCERDLAAGIAADPGVRAAPDDLSLVLEVVLPDDRLALTFDKRGRVRHVRDAEYDVLVIASGSMLVDVIDGRRAWVEPLLAGLLRSSLRGAQVSEGRCEALQVAPMFPYYGLSYRESLERSVMNRARALAAKRQGA